MPTSSTRSTPEGAGQLPASSEHVLADGTRVLVRAVVPADRAALVEGYRKLSTRSRRTRFFSPPDELTEDDLDYLTRLDHYDRCALAAFALDEPGEPGVAVARYVRDVDDPGRAEVAITVLDDYQRRGLGTLLMQRLAIEAAVRDVRTLVYYVLWQNDELIEQLRLEGARVSPDEPGLARIELDLPPPDATLPTGTWHNLVRILARFIVDLFERDPAHRRGGTTN